MFTAAAFLLFAVTFAALALARHPIYGLYFYFSTFFAHPPSRWWGQMLPDLRWSLSSALIVAIAVLLHRNRLKAKPIWTSSTPAAVLIAYATWMWMQTPWALARETHIDGSIQYVKYLLAFWFIYRAVDTKEHLRDLMFMIALGCGILGLLAYFTDRTGDRLEGVGGPGINDANTLGMYLAVGAVVCGGLILTQRGWRQYLTFGAMAFTLNAFVLANSRGALIALVAGTLVLTALKARAHRLLFWSLAVLAVPAAVSIVDETFIERMFTIQDSVAQSEEMDGSSRARVELKKAQIRMFLDHPLGAGHRGTAALSPNYLAREFLTLSTPDESSAARSSHNTFLSSLVEQGVLGATLFLMMFGWLAVTMVRIKRWQKASVDPQLITYGATLCGGLTVVLVAGLATDYLMAEVQFWLLAGLVSVIRFAKEPQAAVQVVAPKPSIQHLRRAQQE